MEAVAAIGFAGSILQFIEFASKVLATGKEVYQNADGALRDNVAIEAIVRHLDDIHNRIQGYSSVSSPAAQTLQKECSSLIKELLNALDNLKAKGGLSRWKSIKKGLKAVRSKAQIEQWFRRLESIREAYNTQLEVRIL